MVACVRLYERLVARFVTRMSCKLRFSGISTCVRHRCILVGRQIVYKNVHVVLTEQKCPYRCLLPENEKVYMVDVNRFKN